MNKSVCLFGAGFFLEEGSGFVMATIGRLLFYLWRFLGYCVRLGIYCLGTRYKRPR